MQPKQVVVSVWRALVGVLLALIPYYDTEYVALYDDGYGVLLSAWPARCVRMDEDDEPDGIQLVGGISWLCKMWFPRTKGEVLSWQEYQQLS